MQYLLLNQRKCYCVLERTESKETKSVLLEVLSASITIWKSSGAKRRPTVTRMGRRSILSCGFTSLAWEVKARVRCQTECQHVATLYFTYYFHILYYSPMSSYVVLWDLKHNVIHVTKPFIMSYSFHLLIKTACCMTVKWFDLNTQKTWGNLVWKDNRILFSLTVTMHGCCFYIKI